MKSHQLMLKMLIIHVIVITHVIVKMAHICILHIHAQYAEEEVKQQLRLINETARRRLDKDKLVCVPQLRKEGILLEI